MTSSIAGFVHFSAKKIANSEDVSREPVPSARRRHNDVVQGTDSVHNSAAALSAFDRRVQDLERENALLRQSAMNPSSSASIVPFSPPGFTMCSPAAMATLPGSSSRNPPTAISSMMSMHRDALHFNYMAQLANAIAAYSQ
jgi:hypothetical protein